MNAEDKIRAKFKTCAAACRGFCRAENMLPCMRRYSAEIDSLREISGYVVVIGDAVASEL